MNKKRGRPPGKTNAPKFINITLKELLTVFKEETVIRADAEYANFFKINNKSFEFTPAVVEPEEEPVKLEFKIE